jgi:asparagine synthase (glutamine-hydrolysing)
MSPIEIVRGYVFGLGSMMPAPVSRTITPRCALEGAVREGLLRPPCGVAFSGGRDSSLVLAIATSVARREGLPEPIAITQDFPLVIEADETRWQELVIRHLRLRDWERVPIRDELDLVGPLAREHLRRHGVVWPTTIARDVPLLEIVRGGSLLDGEGGDEVLGDANHRVAPFARLVRRPRPLRTRRVRAAVAAVGPAPLRARRVQRFWDAEATPWLRPRGRALLLDGLAQSERQRPLAFATSVRRVPVERHHVLAARNRKLQARAREVVIRSPLLDPEVVHAFARRGGLLGPGDRTTMLRELIPDLLPDEVLARTSKADFTDCYMGRVTREFALRWDGRGVDHQLVDADELRRRWLDGPQHALTAPLLQQAWLASHHPA